MIYLSPLVILINNKENTLFENSANKYLFNWSVNFE